MKIYRFDSLPSTNEYAKQLRTDEDAAVIADEQPAGKGSKGRSFASKKGAFISLCCASARVRQKTDSALWKTPRFPSCTPFPLSA